VAFEGATHTVGAGAVDLTTTGPGIEATIVANRQHRRVVLKPTQTGPRVAFLGTCEPTPLPQAQRAQEPALGEAACVHRAAAALAARERDPTWRRPHNLTRENKGYRALIRLSFRLRNQEQAGKILAICEDGLSYSSAPQMSRAEVAGAAGIRQIIDDAENAMLKPPRPLKLMRETPPADPFPNQRGADLQLVELVCHGWPSPITTAK
jgi:hypothetical protein